CRRASRARRRTASARTWTAGSAVISTRAGSRSRAGRGAPRPFPRPVFGWAQALDRLRRGTGVDRGAVVWVVAAVAALGSTGDRRPVDQVSKASVARDRLSRRYRAEAETAGVAALDLPGQHWPRGAQAACAASAWRGT